MNASSSEYYSFTGGSSTSVPGNLHKHDPPASSPVGLALAIFCSRGTAGSIDPPPHGRRSPPPVLGVAQGELPPSSGLAIASARWTGLSRSVERDRHSSVPGVR